MTSDTRDALLVGLFFVGYAIVLAIVNRPTVQRVAMDLNRLGFVRSRRDELIAEEMNVPSPEDMSHA
jgi:hypothetical protein